MKAFDNATHRQSASSPSDLERQRSNDSLGQTASCRARQPRPSTRWPQARRKRRRSRNRKLAFRAALGEQLEARNLLAGGDELGTNDFQISTADAIGVDARQTFHQSLAYNSTDNEYLAVWQGNDTGAFEVYIRRLDESGNPLGPATQVSDMGPSGNLTAEALAPRVAWNQTDNEYLVVWYGDDGSGGLADGEFEIYGQRLNNLGAEVGTNDFRISQAGTDGNAAIDAVRPSVVHNSSTNEYLVAWTADLNDEAAEVYGQRLSNTGAEIGSNDFRISQMGSVDSDVRFDAFGATLAYNSLANEYLVLWSGDDAVDGDVEIYAQRLSAAGAALDTGTELGGNDFRVSNLDGSATKRGNSPAAVYNPTADEYLIAWYGDHIIDGRNEIFIQRLQGNSSEVAGFSPLTISAMGPAGNAAFDAFNPSVSYNGLTNEYLVTWHGDQTVDNEVEIHGQRLLATGTEFSIDDFRISDLGGDGDPARAATNASVVFNAAANEFLVTWYGDDVADGELEIYGQRLHGWLGPAADIGGPYTGVEGVEVAFDASGTADPDDPNSALLFEWDVDYDGVTFDPFVSGMQPSLIFRDDFPTRTIALRVTDPDGHSDISTTTLTVVNDVPDLSDVVVEASSGGLVTFRGSINELGPSDPLTVTITWPDSSTQVLNLPITSDSFAASRTFTSLAPGATFQVAVDDGDGGTDVAIAELETVVTTTADSGAGSLRHAMLAAELITGSNTVTFDIPGAGPHSIQPLSTLPILRQPIVIDGYSQPGSAAATSSSAAAVMIELDGSNVSGNGLSIAGGSSTVRGLAVNRFGIGISLFSNNSNQIVGTYIGTDVTGSVPLANTSMGIAVSDDSWHNIIGGSNPAERNLVSGNGIGILLDGSHNIIQGNIIGLDVTGQHALGNSQEGIRVRGAAHNLIGGSGPGEGNVLSANARGVELKPIGSAQSTNNSVIGNLIGTDLTGTADLGNRLWGVLLFGGSGNWVAENVISGNDRHGIEVLTGGGHIIQRNTIGRSADGSSPLGNSGDGVHISFAFSSSDNLIGGINPGEGNLIASNAGDGVAIGGKTTDGSGQQVGPGLGNAILGNAIFDNGGLGIDLFGANGVTANDALDTDIGGNGLQNFPAITSAIATPSTTELSGTIESSPDTALRIEFFWSDLADPSGFGEGQQFLGAVDVTTDALGIGQFAFTVPGALPTGAVITATATDGDGSTSEFSAGTAVVAADTLVTTDAAGNLVIEDVVGSLDDDLQLRSDGTNLVITHPGRLVVSTLPGIAGSPGSQLPVPWAAFTGGVLVEAQGGDDLLTLDYATGDFERALTFIGGAHGAVGDQLLLINGSFESAAVQFFDSASAAITPSGSVQVAAFEVEPITSRLDIGDVVLQYSSTSETINVVDEGPGRSTIGSTYAPPISLRNPTSSLAILAGAGDDVVDIQGFGAGFDASLTVDGQDESDRLTLNTGLELGSAASHGELQLVAESILLDVDATSPITTTGSPNAGSVLLDGSVQLGGHTVIRTDGTSGGGDLTITGAVNGLAPLEVFSGVDGTAGDVRFGRSLGETVPLQRLHVSTRSTIALGGSVWTDGPITFANHLGNLLLNNSVRMDTEQGNNGPGGSVTLPRVSASAVGFDLEVDTSSLGIGTPGGSVSFQQFTATPRPLNDVLINTTGSSPGQVEMLSGVFLLDDDGGGDAASFTILGGGDFVLQNVSRLDTELGDDGPGGSLDLRGARVGRRGGAPDITLDTSTVAAGQPAGDVWLGELVDQGSGLWNDIAIHAAGGANSTGGGSVVFDGNVPLADLSGDPGSLAVTAGHVEVRGEITLLDGSVDITAERGVLLSRTSFIETNSGDITLRGNPHGTAEGAFAGIDLRGAEIATNGGNITLIGRGGTGEFQQHGIQVSSSVINSFGQGAAVGSVTFDGHGGTGTFHSSGVRFELSHVQSYDGDVQITGQGGITGHLNYGVDIRANSSVRSRGIGSDAASITIQGTGGRGVDGMRGVSLTESRSSVTSIDGDIVISGQGGDEPSSGGHLGVFMGNGTLVESTGQTASAAKISIIGVGGAGNRQNGGVFLNSAVVSFAGNVSVQGTAASAESVAVFFGSEASVRSTGSGPSSASITISGAAEGGAQGVLLQTTANVTSRDGAITILGDGGSYGGGVVVEGGVSATGTASISIEAYSDFNLGVRVSGVVITSSGSVRVTSPDGLMVEGTGVVTTSSGPIDLDTDELVLATSGLAVRSSAGRVTLAPLSAGRELAIGFLSSDKLSVTGAEVAKISAPVLQLGNATAGSITLANFVAISAPTTRLETGGQVVGLSSGVLDASELVIDAGSGVTMHRRRHSVNVLAAHVDQGDFLFAGLGTMYVDTVDGRVGVTTEAGNIRISASPLRQREPITANGGNLFLIGDSPITVDAPLTAVGGGDVILDAQDDGGGDDDLTINAPVQAVGGDGSVILNAGSNLQISDSGAAEISVEGAGTISATVKGTTEINDDVSITTAGGDITLLTNDLSLSSIGTSVDSGSGTITVAPSAAGQPIDLGSDAAGSLGLTQEELGQLSGAALVIGSETAGEIVVSQDVDLSNVGDVTLATEETVTGEGSIEGAPVQTAAASGGILLAGRTLQIQGTSGADDVLVERAGEDLLVTANFGGSAQLFTVAGALVDEISVSLLGDDDTVLIAADVTQQATLLGGGGNDSLTAGGGNTTLNGGPGDDLLSGGTANNSIIGGSGSNTFVDGGGVNVVTTTPGSLLPEVFTDTYQVNEGSVLTIAAADGLLANDATPVGTTMSALTETGPAHGQLLVTADGSFSYTHDPGFEGTDGFTYRAINEHGASSAASVSITVNNVAPADVVISSIGDGAGVFPIDQPVPFQGSFTDAGVLDVHTAFWTFTHAVDQTVTTAVLAGSVTEADGTGVVLDELDFSQAELGPGVYSVTLTVIDDSGAVTVSEEQLFVIYDPSGGFVTGGGWIDSPAGAYRPDPTLTGKANFGFVSKYKKGAAPVGETEFRFRAGQLDFHSASYQWLVIAGARAQYKGVGTINGSGNYGFLLTAIDGDRPGGGGTDKFRMKIWDIDDGETIVYDNQDAADGDDSAVPNTVLGGGNIVIHKPSNSSVNLADAFDPDDHGQKSRVAATAVHPELVSEGNHGEDDLRPWFLSDAYPQTVDALLTVDQNSDSESWVPLDDLDKVDALVSEVLLSHDG